MIVVYDGNNTVIRGNSVTELYFQGKRTSGIYITFTQLLADLTTLQKNFSISEVIFAWDSLGGSFFRKELYPEYKANRHKKKEDPDNKEFYSELRTQMKDLQEVFPKLGIRCEKHQGWEADDIISCITQNTEEEVVIVSTDKDLLQLISPKVMVYNPTKKIVYTVANFKELVGIDLNRFVDLKVLVGDKSDNIDGIQGMGDKTAIKLLSEYGSLDTMFRNPSMVKKSVVTDRLFSLEGRKKVIRNRLLMNLKTTDYTELNQAITASGEKLTYSQKELVAFARANGLRSVLTNINSYNAVFKAIG